MAVSVNQILANTLGLADPLGRIADDGRVGFNGRVNINGRPIRFAPNFDAVDDYGVLATKAINPDGTIDIEWEQRGYDSAVAGSQTIVAQCNSTTITSREFVLRVDSNETLSMFIGGSSFGTAAGVYGDGKWRSLLVGSNWSVFKDGTLVLSTTIARGAAREPTARTTIAARDAGAAQADYMKGLLYNIRINGTLWRMADRNQAIQLPEPSGLGAELITPTVLENPAVKGSQWTYLGAGRWQYIGDGTLNVLQFIAPANQPAAGYIEFEVESVSGTCTAAANNIAANFNTTGIKRYFYTSSGASNSNLIEFKRASGTASCIIKNISFKPLIVANSTELVTNGDFSAGTTGWTAQSGGSLSVVSGQATITTTAGQNSRIEQTLTVQGGFYHEASFDIVALNTVTFARLSVFRGAVGGFAQLADVTRNSAGRISVIFFAPGNDAVIQVRGDFSTAGSVIVDSVSVRKLDSLCNPMTLVNVTSDRWQEVAQ